MQAHGKPAVHVARALVRRGELWLITRRRTNTQLAGLWEFSGGKIEAGETAEQAALRELFEECGVQAVAVSRLPAVVREYDAAIVRLEPVVCDWVGGEVAPRFVAAYVWVTAGGLRSVELPAANRGIVDAIFGGRY